MCLNKCGFAESEEIIPWLSLYFTEKQALKLNHVTWYNFN